MVKKTDCGWNMDMYTNRKKRRLAGLIQGSLPLERRPFRFLAERAGLAEEEILSGIGEWKREGIVRKFGAVLRHREAGFGENAMVLWAVSPDRREEAGRVFASFPEVSHCYERMPAFEGRYVLYTMVHGRGRPLEEIVSEMARRAGIGDFRILKTVREFKKTSMRYFP